MYEEKKICVLYIDDEVNNLVAFKANFRRVYEVYTAESAAEGLSILKEKKVHVIITDQRMPRMTGSEFLASIVNEFPDPIRILLTGYADMEAIVDAINKAQIFRYMTKPWNEKELKMTIHSAFEVYTLRQEKKELIANLEQANKQLEFLFRQKLLS
jgi:response regulator RpfG family c-di-GMP phosphodiesterase